HRRQLAVDIVGDGPHAVGGLALHRAPALAGQAHGEPGREYDHGKHGGEGEDDQMRANGEPALEKTAASRRRSRRVPACPRGVRGVAAARAVRRVQREAPAPSSGRVSPGTLSPIHAWAARTPDSRASDSVEKSDEGTATGMVLSPVGVACTTLATTAQAPLARCSVVTTMS